PRRSKPESDRGDEIDHGEKHRGDLPANRAGTEAAIGLVADTEDIGPMIEALEHGDTGHDPQENDKTRGPAPDFFAPAREIARAGTNSSASGPKCRSTSASPTSPRPAGRQRGALSLSMIVARTPS